MAMETKYHILLLGGTGLCGLVFTRAALKAGHTLTLYIRNPSKLPSDLAKNAKITVIQGELSDEAGLEKAAGCGADIFVSLAGPTLGKREGTPITNALKSLYPLLLAAKTFRRILLLSTASYSAPEDLRSIKWFIAINFYIRLIGGDSYTEIRGMAEETVSLGEKIDWTVFRVPLMYGTELDETTGKEGEEVEACYVGDEKGRDGLWLDRGRLARWILGELEEHKWVGACPMVANA